MRRIDLTLLPILCCVFVYCYPVQSKEAASTTAGRLFYLATPSLGLPSLDKETKVIVSFLTPEDGVMISITKQGVDLKQQITLTAMTDYLYNVDTEYIERDGEVTYEWALRLFSDNGYFCVTVSISFNRESTDTVQLLPVAGWGRQYYTVHLRDTFSIQIVVDKGPVNLTVTFRFTSMETSLRYKDIYIYNGDEKQFLVQAQGALEISTCRRSFGKSEDATGTRIVGTANFGVLSFSCHGVTNSSSCSRSDYVIRGLVAEMLLPQECYGTEFIVVPGVLQLEQGFIIVIASEANTDVKLIYSKEELVMLSRAGMSITIDLLQEVYLLRSSLPVQVVYIQRSTCSDKSEGANVGPSMGLLIPTNLFYWLYLFSVPSAFNVSNFLVVVVELPSLHFIQLDNQMFSNDFSLKRAPNNSIWHIGYMSIDSGAHKLVSTQPSPFGSYLYSTSYLHPVGYIAAHVNTECEATIMTMTLSDKKDNDCDRFVDEEVMNEKDDDGDGRIDEDTKAVNVLPSKLYEVYWYTDQGQWTIWEQWQCTLDCKNSNFFRKRFCQNSSADDKEVFCLGEKEAYKSGDCYVASSCPESCPDYQWAINCKNSCSNCVDPCNKFTGRCVKCKEGFKNTNLGCDKECDSGEFGIGCMGNCNEKCGTDCIDRKEGKCPNFASSSGNSEMGDSSVYGYVIGVLVVLLLIAACYCAYLKKKRPVYVVTKPINARPSWDAYMMIPKADFETSSRRSTAEEQKEKSSDKSSDFQKELLKNGGNQVFVDDGGSSTDHPDTIKIFSVDTSKQSESTSSN